MHGRWRTLYLFGDHIKRPVCLGTWLQPPVSRPLPSPTTRWRTLIHTNGWRGTTTGLGPQRTEGLVRWALKLVDGEALHSKENRLVGRDAHGPALPTPVRRSIPLLFDLRCGYAGATAGSAWKAAKALKGGGWRARSRPPGWEEQEHYERNKGHRYTRSKDATRCRRGTLEALMTIVTLFRLGIGLRWRCGSRKGHFS